MEIEDKYINLIGKYIYNKELDKSGLISSMDLSKMCDISYRAFYDVFDCNHIIHLEDFEKGKIQFVLLTGNHIFEKIIRQENNDIKVAFKEKYNDNMIRCVSAEEWDKCNEEQKSRNIQKMHTDLISLTRISTEVFYGDFCIQDLYLKYKNGVLTETEMLYAILNVLCSRNKQLADKNLEYFSKYELEKCLKDYCCNTRNSKCEDNEHNQKETILS